MASLFTKPANLIVLDEPTNDLDIESLELLEELLANYSGTVLLVSHDRHFLDNVVTSTLAFEGNGQVKEYVGGYQDWLRQRAVPTKPAVPKKSPTPPPSPKKAQKLNYQEKRELAELPERIETLETQLTELQSVISNPEFYQNETEQINETLARIKAIKEKLQTAYDRWESLEELSKKN